MEKVAFVVPMLVIFSAVVSLLFMDSDVGAHTPLLISNDAVASVLLTDSIPQLAKQNAKTHPVKYAAIFFILKIL